MTDPNPQEKDARTSQLHALYRDVGRLIALEEASKAPRILIDGDIEVAWPQTVKNQINARIVTKMAAIAGQVRDLQNAE
ncbi:hypothetical protein LCGC14_0829220 [marine sediment metagenome]|uniref:Uncharacterized protein n=1 Tax=marine sediment metagenome TaxID=412755 RepID=A0A0F9S1C4_9ZZZZ